MDIREEKIIIENLCKNYKRGLITWEEAIEQILIDTSMTEEEFENYVSKSVGA